MPFNDNLLTIIPICETDLAPSHLPHISSLANQVTTTPLVELAIGGALKDEGVRKELRALYQRQKIDCLIESLPTTPQGTIERALTVSARTPYLLFLDVHTKIVDGGIRRLLDFIERCSPITLAGSILSETGQLDPRCVLVNAAFLRNAGSYQQPLAKQTCRPLDLVQEHLSKHPRDIHHWAPPIQKIFVFEEQPPEAALACNNHGVLSQPRLFTVCVCAYGSVDQHLSRCLTSILQEPRCGELSSIIVGCNAVSTKALEVIHALQHGGIPISIVQSLENLNKSGMRRIMTTLADTPFIVSCDDDIFLKPGWLRQMNTFLTDAPTADAAGFTMLSKYIDTRDVPTNAVVPYSLYPLRKSWWRWKKPTHSPNIDFPSGAFHVMRTDFIRTHDYPDFHMLIDFDDILLGDLVLQASGKYADFPVELREKIIVDLNPSRGERGKG